jgi:hypothetical protein
MTVSSVATGYDGISLLAGNAAYDPAATFLIQRISPTTGISVTFSSIPQTYKSLQIRLITRDGFTANTGFNLYFNGGATATYGTHRLTGDGTSAAATGSGSNGAMQYAAFTSGTTASIFGASIIDIHDYASTTKNKTTRAFFGYNNNSVGRVGLSSSVWVSTSAITSITIENSNANNIALGSTFALYGMVG